MDADWRDIHIDRSAEIALLQDCWRRARVNGPVVGVIAAESGFGKTRLAQDFFNWLSTTEDARDPDGYWPDTLGSDGDNLRVNPVMPREPPGRTFPFLWWGIRLLRRGRNQQFGSALPQAKEELAYHLTRYEIEERRRELEGQKQTANRDLALEVGVEALGNVTSFGLLGLLKSAAEHRRKTQIYDDQLEAIARDPQAAISVDHLSTIIADLERVCLKPPEGFSPTPLCILIDDAQWLWFDADALALFDRLILTARAQSWPLLLIATCWEREWHRDSAEPGSRSLALHLDSLGAEPVVLELGPLALNSIVEQALPGLTPLQASRLIEKVGGNPQYLRNVIGALILKAELFEDRDCRRALNSKGEAYLETGEEEDFVRDRFESAPPAMQKLLSLASLQGIKFSSDVAIGTGRRLNLSADRNLLARADRPYAFISIPGEATGEFRRTSIWSVANTRVARHFDEAGAREALASALSEAGPAEQALTDEIIAQGLDDERPERRLEALDAVARLAVRAYWQHEYDGAARAASAWLDRSIADLPLHFNFGRLRNLVLILMPTGRRDDFVQHMRDCFAFYSGRCLQPTGELGEGAAREGRVLLQICLVLSDFWFPVEEELKRTAARLGVALTEPTAGTGNEDEASARFARAMRREALQRQVDLEKDPATRLGLLEHQLEFVRSQATEPLDDAFAAAISQSLYRLASTYLQLQQEKEARSALDEASGLWRILLHQGQSHARHVNFAQSVCEQMRILYRPAYSARVRELAKEGLHSVYRAFRLSPNNAKLPGQILALAPVAAGTLRGDIETMTFLDDAEVHLKALLERIPEDSPPAHWATAASFSLAIATISGFLGDYPLEVAKREHSLSLMQRMDPENVTASAFVMAQQAALLAGSSWRQWNFRAAWRYWLQSMRWRKVCADILQEHGHELKAILAMMKQGQVPSLARGKAGDRAEA